MDNTIRLKLNGKDNGIRYVESFTERAHPSNDFEAHIHTHEVEIYVFRDGDIFFTFEGKRVEVQKGSVIIIANDSYHRPIIKSTCRFERAHIFIGTKTLMSFDPKNTELFRRLSKRRIILLPPEKAEALNVDKCFGKVKEYLLQSSEYGEFCAVVTVISLLIGAEGESTAEGETAFTSYSDTVTEITEYVSKNLTADLSYRNISKRFHLSEKYLYKLFKREVGVTLSQYVLERRIVKAQTVLNAGGTAREAAESAGFGDYSVFYRCFLRETGMTPSEYTAVNR